MQHNAIEPKTLTHEEAMTLLRPALPGELDVMRTRLRKVLAGEDNRMDIVGSVMFYLMGTEEYMQDYLYSTDHYGHGRDDLFEAKFNDDGMVAAASDKALRDYRYWIENSICNDRLPEELTEEEEDALPEGFSTLKQWGLSVSDAEIEESLQIYSSNYVPQYFTGWNVILEALSRRDTRYPQKDDVYVDNNKGTKFSLYYHYSLPL